MILRSASIFIFATLITGALHAQDFVVAQSQTEERPAGLLALPEIFGESPCDVLQAKTLDLYATPSKQREPIGIIERLNPSRGRDDAECNQALVVIRLITDKSAERLPTDESGYEEVKAVVYERSADWFRIALPRGSAWIERPDSNGFLSYPEQLSGESFLTYLRPEWDGKIWTTPGVGPTISAPAAWRTLAKEQIPVRVTSTRVVMGEKWIHVFFEAESCGQSFGNLPPLDAWLPAYRSSRDTSIWFYSRGC
jgi:hypothetical protein